jgi:hypothetical protein
LARRQFAVATTLVTLVLGFIADVDEIPDEAAAAGLLRRFAVSMISAGPELSEPFFDRAVLRAVFAALLPLWTVDRVISRKSGGAALIFASSIEAIEEGALAEDPADLFRAMTMLFRDRAVCVVRSIPYFALGGPAPYHDAFVFEFFVPSYDTKEVEGLLRSASCRSAFPLEIVTAWPEPKWGKWARVRRWLPI